LRRDGYRPVDAGSAVRLLRSGAVDGRVRPLSRD